MKRHLDLVKGVTGIVDVQARDDAGAVLNLTGLTGSAVNWKMADDFNDAAPVVTLTIGSGITLTTPLQGKFRITIPAATLAALEAKRYIHQALVTVGGVTYRPLFGNVKLAEDIG